jgi:hypothetical protein
MRTLFNRREALRLTLQLLMLKEKGLRKSKVTKQLLLTPRLLRNFTRT